MWFSLCSDNFGWCLEGFFSEIISDFLVVFKTKLQNYFIEDMSIEQYIYWSLKLSDRKMKFWVLFN